MEGRKNVSVDVLFREAKLKITPKPRIDSPTSFEIHYAFFRSHSLLISRRYENVQMTVLRTCYFNRRMITFVISVKVKVQTSFVAAETFYICIDASKVKKVYFLHYKYQKYTYGWRCETIFTFTNLLLPHEHNCQYNSSFSDNIQKSQSV